MQKGVSGSGASRKGAVTGSTSSTIPPRLDGERKKFPFCYVTKAGIVGLCWAEVKPWRAAGVSFGRFECDALGKLSSFARLDGRGRPSLHVGRGA